MALLYHWREDNYRRDVQANFGSLTLEQNAPWLPDAEEQGQRIWAFTRNSRKEYVLAASYTIAQIERARGTPKYGRFHIRPVRGSHTWFDVENSPSAEKTIRSLSVQRSARILGQAFQGPGAVVRISSEDDALLADFARDVPTLEEPTARPSVSRRLPSSRGAVTIKWNDLDWVDLIPFRFLNGEFSKLIESHSVVRHGAAGSVIARCIVTAKGTRVTVDYSDAAVRSENKTRQLDIGSLILEFTNEKRTAFTPRAVGWREELGTKIKWGEATVYWPAKKLFGKYHPPKLTKAKRRAITVKDRPGQAAFRDLLQETYSCCCVTGNRLPEALEAAHIDQFDGREYDHPKNGLLLRKDLHALFDCGLLAFHPQTRIAYFAKGLAQLMYADLHAKATLKKPFSLFSERAPDEAAIKKRWAKFGRLR